MKVLFFLFVFLHQVFSDCYTPPTDNPFVIPKASERNLDYCSWYNDLTCCTYSPTLQVNFDETNCKAPTGSCADELTLFLCRFCSPFYSEYVDQYGKFQVCGKFADKMYEACKQSEIQVEGQCKTVGSEWKNGKDFVENVFDHRYTDDQKACFNHVGKLQTSIWGILLMICILNALLLVF